MRFTVITILPELIEPSLSAGVVGRARDAGTITVSTINPRDFTTDRHRSVDDTSYGGGPGMVMKPEPVLAAIHAAESIVVKVETVPSQLDDGSRGQLEKGVKVETVPRRILLTPAGMPLTQAKVRELATHPHLVLVCGRYEGVDERIIEAAIDEEISIGDYVLSGGELGALVVIDAVARLVPGVLGEATSADDESHSAGLLEYPQYTRPQKLGEREVPSVLMSGNHAAIAAWRRAQSLERTAARRPDLFARLAQTAADRKLYAPLAARTHLVLVHHPVVDRTGKVVTSSVTNFDIHDLARSTLTYGLAAYHIVTPITSQREKAEHIASLWLDQPGEGPARSSAGGGAKSIDQPVRKPPASGSRAHALALVRTAESIEMVLEAVAAESGRAPMVVATSARIESFPAAARRSTDELRSEATLLPDPLVILLGTGWGLADTLIPSVSRVLAPIEGASDWNHLSVRSAAAILLDRLFGRSRISTT